MSHMAHGSAASTAAVYTWNSVRLDGGSSPEWSPSRPGPRMPTQEQCKTTLSERAEIASTKLS